VKRRAIQARDLLVFPDAAADDWLRLIGALLLCAVGVGFFHQAAWNTLAAVAVGAAANLLALWVGFHRLGLRVLGSVWPGWIRGISTALLLFVVLPPGLPPGLVVGVVFLALVVEGRLRQVVVPLALNGVLVVWPIAWLWQFRFALPHLSPIDLRHLEEPIQLWRHFQLAVDPLRLYTGNVAGPLGATSMMTATFAVLLLAYARRASWHYILGFFAPIAIITAITRRPLTVYLLSGPALVFAGLLGGDMGRLPRSRWWRTGGGIAAGTVAALLLFSGLGWQAFGSGVTVAALGLALLQALGPAGARAPAAEHRPARIGARPALAFRPRLLAELATLLLVPPVGWAMVASDGTLSGKLRLGVVVSSAALFVVAAILSILWVYSLRLPA